MNASKHAQNTLTISERLRAFMLTHELSRADMAAILETPLKTLDGWLDCGRTPPACLRPLMRLLEQCSQVRIKLGVYSKSKAEPRGRPFKKGNSYRFRRKAGAEE